jgi:hypothetical protein
MKFFINRYKNKISSTPHDVPPIIISNGWNGGIFTDYNYSLYKGAGLKYKELHKLFSSADCNDRFLKLCGQLKIGGTVSILLISSVFAIWIVCALKKYLPPMPVIYTSIILTYLGLTADIILEKIAKRIQHIMADNYNLDLLHIGRYEYPELIMYNDKFSLRTYCLHNKTPLTCAEVYTRIVSVAENKKTIKKMRLITKVLWGIALFLAVFTGLWIIGKPILDRLSDAYGFTNVINGIILTYIESIFTMSILRELQTGFIGKCVDTYNITLTRKKWEEEIEKY